ncbi:MAG: metallopeptidase TldD-related protein [Acidimicrobiales bacterium]
MSSGGGLLPAQEVVESVLRSPGGEGRIAIVEERSEAEVRFANNTTTTNGVRRDRRVTVVSLRPAQGGTSAGVASMSGGSASDVAALLAASEADAAGAARADDGFALVEPEADDPAWAEAPAITDLGVLDGVLGPLAEAFQRARSRSEVLAGFAEHRLETVYLGTSTGLRRRHVQPTGKLELVGRSTDGARSAWVGAGTADFVDVDVSEMEARLERRLGWAERRVALEAGRYQTLLPPDAVADLMIPLYGAMGGRDAEEGRSALSKPGGRTRVGEQISELPFDLRSDPDHPALSCAPFLVAGASGSDVSVFDNGLPLGATSWLRGGRLSQLRYHRAGATRSGTQPAPPVDNLLLERPGASRSLEDLVAEVDRGLLLTCLWYIREVDPVTLLLTGLTRDGVYLIERGEVVGAVNNFRFNESPLDVLARSADCSRTERALSREWNEWLNRTAMPALRVDDFNMSTVSPAN